MARAALGWSLTDLASAAGVGRATVARFELGEPVNADSVAKLRAAVEGGGVILFEDGVRVPAGGAGVRLRTS